MVGIAWGYIFCYVPQYSGLLKAQHTAVFSHRWLGDFAPDNSLSWALIAMRDWFDGIDVDGQLTKDHQIVIYHDLSVDRLTVSHGKVNSLTLDQLTPLDLGTKFHSWDGTGMNWSWVYVASFEDFVREITPYGTLMVELKVPGMGATSIEDEAIRIIQKYGVWDRVYLSSFNPFVLWRLKQIDKRVRTVMISMDTNWNPELLTEIRPEDRVDLPWILRQEWIRRGIRKIIHPDALSINHETSESTINTLISKGYPVFLWTVNDPKRVDWARQKSPFGIISDNPYEVQRHLNK